MGHLGCRQLKLSKISNVRFLLTVLFNHFIHDFLSALFTLFKATVQISVVWKNLSPIFSKTLVPEPMGWNIFRINFYMSVICVQQLFATWCLATQVFRYKLSQPVFSQVLTIFHDQKVFENSPSVWSFVKPGFEKWYSMCFRNLAIAITYQIVW